MLRVFGCILVFGAVLGGVGQWFKLQFPTVRFPFTLSNEIGFLHADLEGGDKFPWFGWLVALSFLALGLWIALVFSKNFRFTPITARRIVRFKSIKRGYYSLLIILALAAVASLDHVLVGNEALIVKYNGEWFFPAFTKKIEKAEEFGLEGDDAKGPPNYRELQAQFEKTNGDDFVVTPFLPYSPTFDPIDAVSTELELDEQGLVKEDGELFSGQGTQVYDLAYPERMHLRFRFRNGLKQGSVTGWDHNGSRVYEGKYEKAELISESYEKDDSQYYFSLYLKEYNGTREVKPHYGVRTESHKLVHFYNLESWELYDLEKDSNKTHNRHGQPTYAKITDELKAKLEDLRNKKEDFLKQDSSELRQVHFLLSPPTWNSQHEHPFGTSPKGYDVLAYLFGGLQVNFKAALVYIPLVYAIGITIGLLMGFFGGTFDLIVQRLIEILSNVPFLFVVMIASTAVPPDMKETAGLWILLTLLLLFGWMSMTYLMRTAALKEKARDYIAASRVIGASTPRILFRHILPNSMAIIVTLVPFSISSLILALTSLDYLGFGLPASFPTWGQLLRGGLDNLSAPWLVTSAFTALVGLLILITFVGEAVREAFDPKKFSYYR